MGKKRKFYRATLPTIVWNPAAGKALAEFVNGQFVTEDDDVAERLKSLGYPEVKLDSDEPPMLIPDPVPITSPDVKVMSSGMTEAAMALKQKASGADEDKSPGFTVVGDSLVTDDKSSDDSSGVETAPAKVDESTVSAKPKVVAKEVKTKTTKADERASAEKSKRRKLKRRKK